LINSHRHGASHIPQLAPSFAKATDDKNAGHANNNCLQIYKLRIRITNLLFIILI
jgi:hypothetical protein